MMKKMLVGLVIVALVSSGFTYGVLRLYPGSSNSQNIGTDYQTEIRNLNSSFEQLSGAFDGLNVSLAKLCADLDDSDESLRWDLLQTNESISTVQNNISSFQQAISDLQDQFSAVQGQLNTTANGLYDVQSQMESLSEKVSTVETDVSELSQEVLVLTANATHLNEDVSKIQSDVSMLTTNMQSVQTEIAGILLDISNLGERITTLEGRVDYLNSTRSTVIRINILSFVYSREPPGLVDLTGADWLIDCQVNSMNDWAILAQGRTGHSRFFQPSYLDLPILGFNRTQINGMQVVIRLAAYWHAQDTLIDINPNEHSYLTWNRWKFADNVLTIDYTVGTVKAATVRGYGYNWPLGTYTLLPAYSYATFSYRIQTY